MHVICPSCRQALEFTGTRPKFCGQCGQSLGDAQPVVAVADTNQTVAHTPNPLLEDRTRSFVAPAGHAEETARGSPIPGREETVPEAVGPYRIVRRIGGGGMGTVYEATDPITGRSVALKLVQPDKEASGEALERFRHEGELASKLAHPRCVFVLAAGEDRGRPFIIMELMTGSTLADLVKQSGPLPVPQALGKILDVFDGLQEAHGLGLVHRDVKPSNCFLEADGRVKIGDFGLAKSLERQADLTRTGTFLGTPLYAAPEQIKMEKVDAQSDVYSVAATLYFLLTGQAPFQSRDPMATMAKIVSEDPPPMRTLRPELPKALDQVVLRGLDRDRKRRWRSLEEFRTALRPFMPIEPSVGGVGLRVVAYLLDWVCQALVNSAWFTLLGGLALATNRGALVLTTLLGAATNIFYFGLSEGLWGRSLGKLVFRLRVGTPASARPPGVGRALWRAAVLYLLFNTVNLIALALFDLPNLQEPEARAQQAAKNRSFLLVMMLAPYVEIGLLVCTMRKRNGYRAIHEVLSGTRTYQVRRHKIKKLRALEAPEYFIEVSRPAGLPERVGTYDIRGAIRWTPDDQTLLGVDDKLGRGVWIWIRPAKERALPEAERNIGRTTRMRWVSCGTLDGRQWDAFLAPTGCPLTTLVASGRRLNWLECRNILEELTEELRASCAEGSMPDTLTPDQVWISRGGRMQLLGVPFAAESEREKPANDGRTDQQRAMTLVNDVAQTALEGRTRSEGEPPSRIRAPLPLYAARLLGRLMPQSADSTVRNPYERIEDFQTDLLGAQAEPAAVTRELRAKQLIFHTIFVLLALGVFGAFLPAVFGYGPEIDDSIIYLELGLGFCFFLLPAFLTRGGFSFMVAGIGIVKFDGRRASRLRCLWRAVLSWALFALVVAIVFVSWVGIEFLSDSITPSLGEHGPLVFNIVVGVAGFGGLAALLLRNPARGPQDFLARTYLVPK